MQIVLVGVLLADVAIVVATECLLADTAHIPTRLRAGDQFGRVDLISRADMAPITFPNLPWRRRRLQLKRSFDFDHHLCPPCMSNG